MLWLWDNIIFLIFISLFIPFYGLELIIIHLLKYSCGKTLLDYKNTEVSSSSFEVLSSPTRIIRQPLLSVIKPHLQAPFFIWTNGATRWRGNNKGKETKMSSVDGDNEFFSSLGCFFYNNLLDAFSSLGWWQEVFSIECICRWEMNIEKAKKIMQEICIIWNLNCLHLQSH